MTWVLPMIAERTRDPIAFAESTVEATSRYDSAEWIEAFETDRRLRSSGVLLEGSGATDYATMQQLLLQGKAAMTFNGSWLLPQLLGRAPTGPVRSPRGTAPSSMGRRSLARSLRGLASRCRPRPTRAATACTRSSSTRVSPTSTGRRRGPPDVLADRRVERQDRRRGATRVPADVQGRDHAPRLAVGAGDHGRDRQPGPGPREGDTIPRSAARPSRPSQGSSTRRVAATTPDGREDRCLRAPWAAATVARRCQAPCSDKALCARGPDEASCHVRV